MGDCVLFPRKLLNFLFTPIVVVHTGKYSKNYRNNSLLVRFLLNVLHFFDDSMPRCPR
jgi:hypothetical protein